VRLKKVLGLAALLMAVALVATACPAEEQAPGGDGEIPFGNNENGANFNGWNNKEATDLMKASDVELDLDKRVEQFKRIGELAREDVASIPLFAKPAILIWRSDRLGQDLDFEAAQVGFSRELSKWTLKGDNTLKFGSEQWPECLNPVTACSNSSWMAWHMTPTQIYLITADNEGNYIPSPLIKKIPNEADGSLVKEPFSVTYELNDMTWEDGSPITGEDIKFTWQAMMETPDAVSRVGYEDIDDITTQGNKVTIKFKKAYAPWQTLLGSFGAPNGYILKKAAFPKGPNVTDEMADNMPFAGGPYKLESFSDTEIILVANAAYKGPDKPKIPRIVFRNLQAGGQAAEVAALRTGEIDVAFPQIGDALREIGEGKVPNAKIKMKAGTTYEGLWFNLDMYPVNDKSVREAILNLLDRKTAVDTVFGWTKAAGFEHTVNRCLLYVKSAYGGKFCNDDFPDTADPDAAKKALLDGGWTLFDGEGEEVDEAGIDEALEAGGAVWKKDGKALTLKYGTTAGNTGREQAQLIFIRQMVGFGIDARTDNSPSGFLFQIRHPNRDWSMLQYAAVAPPDPTVTANWAGDQIPGCETCPNEP
jgi:peptide/nickel transport system substrate-binding protein